MALGWFTLTGKVRLLDDSGVPEDTQVRIQSIPGSVADSEGKETFTGIITPLVDPDTGVWSVDLPTTGPGVKPTIFHFHYKMTNRFQSEEHTFVPPAAGSVIDISQVVKLDSAPDLPEMGVGEAQVLALIEQYGGGDGGGTGGGTAASVQVAPNLTLVSTNVQDALEELDTEVQAIPGEIQQAVDDMAATKADLVDGVVPMSQLSAVDTITADALVKRRPSGSIPVPNPSASDEPISLGYADGRYALIGSGGGGGGTGDVRTVMLGSNVQSVDDVTWLDIPDLEIVDGQSGQVWDVSLKLKYRAAGGSAGGMWARIAVGSPNATTADWQIDGNWHGLTTLATSNAEFSQVGVIDYPASANVSMSVGGANSTTVNTGLSVLNGQFTFRINGTGLTGRRIGFQFKQRSTAASLPTIIVAGSRAIFSRVV